METKTGKRLFRGRGSRRYWLLIILAALGAHLAFFIFFQPSYLDVFSTKPPGDEGTSSAPRIDKPFSLIPYPEEAETPIVSEIPSIEKEEEKKRSLLDEVGAPALDVEPIAGGKPGGGSAGREGPRRTSVEPKPLFLPWPRYPEGVKKDYQGKVELLLFVDEYGEVREIKLSRGLPHQALNETAVRAARNIRFIPGEVAGVKTAMWVRLTIGFQPRR